MRCFPSASVAVLCLFVVVMVIVSASAAPGPGFSKAQTKPRTIRGFKNVVLSTARNFGKRAGLVTDQGEFVDEGVLQGNMVPTAGNSFPVQWFVEEMQSNPELARAVVRKFIDENQDGELSPEELFRPIY